MNGVEKCDIVNKMQSRNGKHAIFCCFFFQAEDGIRDVRR